MRLSIPSSPSPPAGTPGAAAFPTVTQTSRRAEESRWFAEEVLPHERPLRSWIRAKFPSLTDVDDIVQEAYSRLIRARKLGKIADVRPYLFAVARNISVDLFRKHRGAGVSDGKTSELMALVDNRPDAGECLSRRQEIELLAEAMRSLPERCRQVLTLRKLHGLSHREIAERLGISEHTVDAQVTRGLFRCRQFLRRQGFRT